MNKTPKQLEKRVFLGLCIIMAMGLTACKPKQELAQKVESPVVVPKSAEAILLEDISKGIRELHNLRDPNISEIFSLIDQLDVNRNLNTHSLIAIKNVIDQRKVELLHTMVNNKHQAEDEISSDLALNLKELSEVVAQGEANGLKNKPNAVRFVYEDMKQKVSQLAAKDKTFSGLKTEIDQMDTNGTISFQSLSDFVAKLDDKARNFDAKESMTELRAKTNQLVENTTHRRH